MSCKLVLNGILCGASDEPCYWGVGGRGWGEACYYLQLLQVSELHLGKHLERSAYISAETKPNLSFLGLLPNIRGWISINL